MGAKDSKATCINYEEAVRRVSGGELKRIKEAFKRCSAVGSSTLSKSAFTHEVLGDGVPPVLAEWLYVACGGTSKGIPFKELLCGLVLLTKGTPDEKIKFLWNLYCNDSGTSIVKTELQKTLQSELIYQNNHSRLLLANGGNTDVLPAQPTPSAVLTSLFGHSDRVSFEQFRQWMMLNKRATVLSRWLLFEPYVNLTPDLETPTFFQSLAGVTHLEEQDIRDLERVFCRLKSTTPMDQLDLESLGPMLSPPIPQAAVPGVFNAFDENRDGHVDFKELCCGVSAACRGPTVERSKFLFKVFDLDRDGRLNGGELREMVEILMNVAKDNCQGGSDDDTDRLQVIRESILAELREHSKKSNGMENEGTERAESDNIGAEEKEGDEMMMMMKESSSTTTMTAEEEEDVDEDAFQLSQEAFLMWCVESPQQVVQQLLDLLFDVCHIVLGLRPQCRHIEQNIVRGWMQREQRRGYRIGQFWYLLAADWWQSWLSYTQTGRRSCTSCRTITSTATGAAINTSNNSHNTSLVNIAESSSSSSSGGNGSQSINGGGGGGVKFTINGGNSATGMASGSSSSGNGSSSVDEAIICDESFTSQLATDLGDTSSLGSASSGISSLGRNSNGLNGGSGNGGGAGSYPGTIDNACLVEGSVYKNVPTLTGEGGRLKRDTTLCQHRDFELVPDTLWRALSMWYNGPLALPRQVIQPVNAMEVELELYPLSLRILRHTQNPQPATAASNNAANNVITSTWGAVGGAYGALSNAGYSTGGGGGANSSQNQAAALQTPKKYLAYLAAFSRLATVRQVGDFLCQRLKLRPEDVRLWHVGSSLGAQQYADMPYLWEEEQLTLEDLAVADNDQILLEIRNKDLTWPEELGSLSAVASGSGGTTGGVGGAVAGIGGVDRRPTIDSVASTHAPGATGLHNLGNTCFINAALQVLFNTQPLTQYFRQNMHLYELNVTNRMGTKGQLALRYAELLKEVWNSSTRSVAPLKLRFCITKHNSDFAGGGQHDSQELLAWFLDVLHEDLNRVTERTYSELQDSDGRPDSEVAMEAWKHHYARNGSIVMDLFCGQLKSKVACLACGHESVRFDPFNVLNLPLPVENFTYCEVMMVLLDGTVPVRYGLRLNSECKYKNLKWELAELCEHAVEPELMLCCEVADAQIRCILPDEMKIKVNSATEIYVYELPKGGCCDRPRTSSEMGVNIEKGLKDIQRTAALRITTPESIVSHSMTNGHVTLPLNGLGGGSGGGGGVCPSIEEEYVTTRSQNRRTSKQQSDEVSCSPESSFIKAHPTVLPMTPISASSVRARSPAKRPAIKTISSTNLLNATDNASLNSEQDEVHVPPSPLRTINRGEGKGENDETESSDSSAGDQPSNDASGMVDEGEEEPTVTAKVRTCVYKAAEYVVAVHRQLSRQDTYFLQYHKTKPNLFGLPLLVPWYEGCTNKDLYCAVWIQVARFLSPLPPTPPDQANHATDCDDSLGYEFPFKLKAVAEGGRVCAFCDWTRFCRGCDIPCNDEPLLQDIIAGPVVGGGSGDSTVSAPSSLVGGEAGHLRKNVASDVNLSGRNVNVQQHRRTQSDQMNRVGTAGGRMGGRVSGNLSAINIAIDWDPTALYLRYQSTREKMWTEHESVAVCRRQQIEPVDLDHCLRAFTSEERLEEGYHCSSCKALKPATKKLQIWKLPPIMVVHLKRFNDLGNNRWVKSQKVVHFPYENFDPTPYLASIPQETILRHSDLKMEPATGLVSPMSAKNFDIPEGCEEDSGEVNGGGSDPQVAAAAKMSPTKGGGPSTLERRKRLISTSLIRTPVMDGDLVDYHNHRLKSGYGEFDLKYSLYAVVSHSGMLNGGHYISYAANPNGMWYCYNDSSCREIPQRPNIDPGSAYLLFYERQGLDYGRYLPNVQGRTIPNGVLSELEESDNDLKKMCVVS